MAENKVKKKLPTPSEQKELNKKLDNATPSERSRLAFVQIDIAEWGAVRLEIPSNLAKQFAFDVMNGILSKGNKIKNTPGGIFAKNVLARSFSVMMNSVESGKNGAEKRWGEQPTKEPYLAQFPDGTGGNPF